MPPARRIAFSAAVALAAGLSVATLLGGFSASSAVRTIQWLAIVGLAAAVLFGGAILIALKMADWSSGGSEAEFDELVEESERLAAEGLAAEPDEGEFMELDPWSDEDFEELVADALDDLPDLLREALNPPSSVATVSPAARATAAEKAMRRAGGIAA